MDKNKMLIDATHPEETRVVAVRNGRVEDFDFESAARKLLRGNIYLAKVTRVEPSLQAAFIDYGGNRHGFLAFNEIHPDYYQIPVADRELLKQEEAEAEQRAEEEADERAHSKGPKRRRRSRNDRPGSGAQPRATDVAGHGAQPDDGDHGADHDSSHDDAGHRGLADEVNGDGRSGGAQALRHDNPGDNVLHGDAGPVDDTSGDPIDFAGDDTRQARSEAGRRTSPGSEAGAGQGNGRHENGRHEHAARRVDGDQDGDAADDVDDDAGEVNDDEDQIEQVANEDDALEELPERPRRRARQYKIQEVIKRRQIMLVQVVKEERGNKGAALTTYISLAGRYTVLMPNTARGGGISRKITQPQDRKRLKAIAEELDVPEGMGLIIRTAGAARTKQEIKRDYEYLLRLWESVRDVTLSSTAPCLVYEEGNIIKRAIRDLYSKDFDQIVVAGDVAHREARDFMEMLMPGNGGHVAAYRDPEPLFARYSVERQLGALFSPYVTLRSGGYIVINQTEALVSVDVNSGKSTREFSIEETALNTNLEASDEIARQLKLRDLAGLIVIDFIDMEEKRNNRAVERRLKDALRHDRARIQVGRISHFGLLEMSRQRLRAGVLEGSTSQCPHCQGTGIIRSIESVSLAVLRGLEEHLLKQVTSLTASTTAEVALYILNHKRQFIVDMERRHGILVRVEASDRMHGANFAVERFAAPVVQAKAARAAVSMEWGFDRDEDVEDVEDAAVEEVDDTTNAAHVQEGGAEEARSGGDDERRGRRRRRRRGRRDREGEGSSPANGHAGNGADGEHRAGPDVRGAGEDIEADDEVHARYSNVEEIEADGDSDSDSDNGSDDIETGGERAEPGADSDRPRRGRRRGRRGGRSRRRDEQDGLTAEQPSLDDADRHEWGIAEIAKPGADQPAIDVGGSAQGQAMDFAGSDAKSRSGRERQSIRASRHRRDGRRRRRASRRAGPAGRAPAKSVRVGKRRGVETGRPPCRWARRHAVVGSWPWWPAQAGGRAASRGTGG